MPASQPLDTAFTGVRRRYRTPLSSDRVLANLHAEVGANPVRISEIAKATSSWAEFEAALEPLVGPSGFMLFDTMDHGAWIKKKGISARLQRLIIGNPLIAITIISQDLTAGLFAPVELLLADGAGGKGCELTYVVPSSLMVIEQNLELLTAARGLDVKLNALAQKVTAA